MTRKQIDRFVPGSFGSKGGTYTCHLCGKKTRDTGNGERGCMLCKHCFVECEMENSLSDGYIKCPGCGEENEISIEDERYVCGKCGKKSEKRRG
jgi:ribosomal protein S27AE